MKRLASLLVTAAVALFSAALNADDRQLDPLIANMGTEQNNFKSVTIPGTDYRIDFSEKHSGGVYPSRSLIKAIKKWLSINFNLRATYPDPIIKLAPPETIILLRYHGLFVGLAARYRFFR